MHLRSGVSIKLGHISSEKGGSLPSTQASSSKTPVFNPSPRSRDLETSSESSMSTGPEASVKMPDETGLDYNTKLNFQGLNVHNAKIYKDNQGRYVVKVEDHPSEDEPSVMANYQGDRYMGPHGVMYLLVEDLASVGPLGELMPRPDNEPDLREVEERPPEMSPEDMRLINSFRVNRVPIDDNAKALYSREEGKETSFYLGHHPRPNTLTPEKTLYVYYPRSSKAVGILVFLDKFGQEWTLIEDKELHTLMHLGIPLTYYYIKEGGPKGMGIEPPREAPHVSFLPLKPEATSLPRA